MNSKCRVPLLLSILATTGAAFVLSVVGCALDKNAARSQNVVNRIGGHSGQIIEPKRCLLRVAILSRPFGDPVINDVIWRVADEQVVPPAERRAWEANGLRIGRLIGDFPPELDAILRDNSPQKGVNPSSFFVESGEQTLISISQPVEEASILLNRDNHPYGKPFKDASGFFRVTVAHEGARNVSLRLVPELHHGPIQRTFQALPNAAALAPQELRIHDGQREETLRDLPANLVLEPAEVAVVGCYPDQKRALGAFLFTQAEAHSDQRRQKLILIWASRNLDGVIDGTSKTTDRPRRFKWKTEPSPSQPAPQPALPALPASATRRNSSQSPSSDSRSPATAAPANQTDTKPNGPNAPDVNDQND